MKRQTKRRKGRYALYAVACPHPYCFVLPIPTKLCCMCPQSCCSHLFVLSSLSSFVAVKTSKDKTGEVRDRSAYLFVSCWAFFPLSTSPPPFLTILCLIIIGGGGGVDERFFEAITTFSRYPAISVRPFDNVGWPKKWVTIPGLRQMNILRSIRFQKCFRSFYLYLNGANHKLYCTFILSILIGILIITSGFEYSYRLRKTPRCQRISYRWAREIATQQKV